MIVLAAILFFLAIIGLFAYAVPPLIGLVIIAIGNGVSKTSRGKIAPIWWDVLTVVVTIISTGMFYKDIFNDNVDTGPQPFILLAVYGFFSLIFIAALSATNKKNTHKTKKKAKQNGVVVEHWSNDLQKGLKRSNNSPSGKEYDWKLKETWEDYPAPDYDAVHTYCSIAFDDSGKTFYYRTRNPEISVGDFVYVPVGYKYEKRIGRVVEIKNYVGRNAPYPLERTKFIKGKVDDEEGA